MSTKLHFCVFSYNRGTFLDNCIQSIENLAPGNPVSVFDDMSSDAETREVLDRISRRHEVVASAGARETKHGGLYANMQSAYERFDRGWLCFLQDDTQLVRPVDQRDLAEIGRWFESDRAGFLHPAFLRGRNRRRDTRHTRYHPHRNAYTREGSGQGAGVYYSDICIFDVSELKRHQWRFQSREVANDLQARQLFEPMGIMHTPFAMWLPSVPAYRGRVKTMAMKFAERRQKCGLHPIRPLADEAVQALRQRPPESLPFAEDFLRAGEPPVPAPWRYYPLQNAPVLKLLDRLERRWR